MNKKIINLKSISQSALRNSLIIVLIGVIIFYIDDCDFFDYKITLALTLVISLLKCYYFIMIGYYKVLEASVKNTVYYKFILFMTVNILVIIASFATDFFCLVQIDPRSLIGIKPNSGVLEKLFDCLYFSILNFSFFGYGDILPSTIPAKIILMVETLISYLSIIVILSDFVSLKESLASRNKK